MADKFLCKIDGCSNTVKARGWCSNHYENWRVTGYPLLTPKAPRRCAISGCDNLANSRGMCRKHYTRWQRTGDPVGKRSRPSPVRDYFEKTILTYEGKECLFWPFAKDQNGYGRLGKKAAHRLVCEAHNGPPPSPESQAAHSCGNGHMGCVAKFHLSWKTCKQNMQDKVLHGKSARGEKHPMNILSKEQVLEIRSLKGEMSQKDIASLYGVSRSTIGLIHTSKNWKWL